MAGAGRFNATGLVDRPTRAALQSLERRIRELESTNAGRRNLIDNGAMNVAQRGASVAGVTAGGLLVDRWLYNPNALGTWTVSQQVDAPSGSGLTRSLKMLCTTADASPAAGDYVLVQHVIEGQFLQHLMKGTSNALPMTLSFWLKTNVTGTGILEVLDATNARIIESRYTLNGAGTWSQVKITIPGDATGAFANSNAGALQVNFWLAAGSNFTSGTLATSWTSSVSADRAVGQTNVGAAANNYWQITGVQLEVGTVATPFEVRRYDDELRQCMRYYRQTTPTTYGEGSIFGYQVAGNSILQTIAHPVPMRAAPTAATAGTWGYSNTTQGAAGVTLYTSAENYAAYITAVATGVTYTYTNGSGYLTFSAEI